MVSVLTPEAIQHYEAAGEIHKNIGRSVKGRIRSGARLLEIAEYVEAEIRAQGAKPAFPCNISVNEIASHDTPSRDDERTFKDGDVVKLDYGVCVNGYVADAAFTVEIGTNDHAQLLRVAKETLDAGIHAVKPRAFIRDIGRAMYGAATSEGHRTIKDLLGHNMGRYCLHGGLTIPSYDDGSYLRVKEGDVLAIEPFVTMGTGAIMRLNGGNIYQAIRNDAIYAHGGSEKSLLACIVKEYNGFPFAERWLQDTEGLHSLVKSGCLRNYPVLVEADRAPVAQAESTVIVEREGCRVIA